MLLQVPKVNVMDQAIVMGQVVATADKVVVTADKVAVTADKVAVTAKKVKEVRTEANMVAWMTMMTWTVRARGRPSQ